ncbi:nuclear transport factor 2 family protein [Actinocorallia sp. API 0066]|uniref:nuclear transport factor 2 family protein n=1 Tax=Actinocorallia sp. API 0066 TaxID=2896846 RepID=UPI001E60FADB|nr:nuclear transport factor 2 family protein [Actinocorallia sp. API 0066]MCD0447979.1 nuclear transport factor 2 family protein [Actinocorallia sp. API 0066]
MDVSARTRPQIEALIAEFAFRVDHRDGEGVAELFIPEGSYSLGAIARLRGRAQIAEFYDRRRSTGPRTSRHLFTNLHVRTVDLDAGRARGTCVLNLHAAQGTRPRPLSPVMIADYDDEYLRAADGTWRFVRRDVSVVFGQVPALLNGSP